MTAKSCIPTLSSQIHAWRRYKKLRQEDLESLAGLSHNAVSRIENGTVSPRLETVEKISAAMDLSVEDLQFRRPPTPENESKHSDLDEVVERLAKQPETKREKLIDMIHRLIDLAEIDL